MALASCLPTFIHSAPYFSNLSPTMAAMHIKEDNEKPLSQHDEGLGDGDGFGTRTTSGGGDYEVGAMVTPGAKWEKRTILKIDLRLLIIRGSCAWPR